MSQRTLGDIVGRDGVFDRGNDAWKHNADRTADFLLVDEGLAVDEGCDGYFGLTLNPVGIRRLIAFLQETLEALEGTT